MEFQRNIDRSANDRKTRFKTSFNGQVRGDTESEEEVSILSEATDSVEMDGSRDGPHVTCVVDTRPGSVLSVVGCCNCEVLARSPNTGCHTQ